MKYIYLKGWDKMKKRNFKKLLPLMCVMGVILFGGKTTLAATPDANTPVDNEIVLEGMQDYENPETGEYLRWSETYSATKGVVKNFTFKIRYSVKSSGVVTNSDSVTVKATANIENAAGQTVSGYTGHKYRVGLERLFWLKETTLSVKGTTSGTISGISSNSKHDLVITNEDYLPSGYYLVGSGSLNN